MEKKNKQKLTDDPRKDFGWFSRRHETRKAHEITKQRRQKLQEDKAQLAMVNRVARQQRTPEEQLALLDQRLGDGIGARKERKKLLTAIFEREAVMKTLYHHLRATPAIVQMITGKTFETPPQQPTNEEKAFAEQIVERALADYYSAFRSACIKGLGEDPETD